MPITPKYILEGSLYLQNNFLTIFLKYNFFAVLFEKVANWHMKRELSSPVFVFDAHVMCAFIMQIFIRTNKVLQIELYSDTNGIYIFNQILLLLKKRSASNKLKWFQLSVPHLPKHQNSRCDLILYRTLDQSSKTHAVI